MADPISSTTPHPLEKTKPYELGVLFVHGIGEQQQGSTLLQFGEPIIETLRRWYMRQTGQGVDCVRLTDSVLLPAKNFSATPAHSVVEFDLRGINRKWLVAEDWWGDQVVVPESTEFLSWLMTRGSWVALLHSMERLTDDPFTQSEIEFYKKLVMSKFSPIRLRKWFADPKNQALANGMLSLYSKPWVLARWMLIALALQIPLTIAYLVTLLPIPGISKWVTTAVRKLASVLGDSFVLVKLESQRAAILTHFEQSLRYLDLECEYVAVLAHSQGTAVVCDVLRTKPGLRPDLLVTFGSGVAKLDQLYLAEAGRRLSLTLAGFIPVIWLLFIVGIAMFPLMNHLMAFSILVVADSLERPHGLRAVSHAAISTRPDRLLSNLGREPDVGDGLAGLQRHSRSRTVQSARGNIRRRPHLVDDDPEPAFLPLRPHHLLQQLRRVRISHCATPGDVRRYSAGSAGCDCRRPAT